jgi:hypothetical protein
VNHRHLLPDEIDLLVDGEAGFGVAPLKTHVEECDECRAELELARALVHDLEALPHFRPSPMFADRVMAQVQVFEPWHVAALETARRLVPKSRPLRVVTAVGAMSGAFVVTLATLAALARLDLLVLFGQATAQMAGSAALAAARDIVAGALGEQAFTTLSQSGNAGIALGLGFLLLSAVGAALGLRAASRVALSRER